MNKQQNLMLLLLKWAGKEKIWLILSVICSFCSGVCTITYYVGLYHIMDTVLCGNAHTNVILDNAIFMLAGTVLRLAFLGIAGILSHKGAYRTLYQVRCKVINHIANIPLGKLDERGIGQIKTLLNEDIEKQELFLAHNLPEFVAYMTAPLVVFAYLLVMNPMLAVISLIPLFIAIVIMGVIFKRMYALMSKAARFAVEFNAAIIEYISCMRLIKAYHLGSNSFEKLSGSIDSSNNMWNEITKKTAPLYSIFLIVVESGMLFMVPIGGMLFLKGSVTSSILILFIYVGGLYLSEILPLQELSGTFAQAMTGVKKTKEILDIPVFEGTQSFPKNKNIEIRDVSFAYDEENLVLHNCNLEIESGQKIALVGESGCGKSTLVQLISRFYDVSDGEIKIGGVNIKNISYSELLNNISMVFQDTFLTSGTVLENIKMGSDAALSEVRKAARDAQIDDFIMQLPNQYETLCGTLDSHFSGGEKQRIAIARAILKDAPILILDEATSAADPENQYEIDKAISNLCKNKTVIIVAHRLGVISMCDKVAVIENKTISSVGTHEEVLAQNKYYQNAWRMYQSSRKINYTSGGMK